MKERNWCEGAALTPQSLNTATNLRSNMATNLRSNTANNLRSNATRHVTMAEQSSYDAQLDAFLQSRKLSSRATGAEMPYLDGLLHVPKSGRTKSKVVSKKAQIETSSFHHLMQFDRMPLRIFEQRHKFEQCYDCLLLTMSFLEVSDVLCFQRVNKRWKRLCKTTIRENFPPKDKFKNGDALKQAIQIYCNRTDKAKVNSIAATYGYPIGKWNVSKVKKFSHAFQNMITFNEDIGDWDVSGATSMKQMFCGASKFNKPLHKWDTSKVVNMFGMFAKTDSFNQNVESWNTSQVKDTSFMFHEAKSFNHPVQGWDVSHVKMMAGMFSNTQRFNQSLWNWRCPALKRRGHKGIIHDAEAFASPLPRELKISVAQKEVTFLP